MHFEKSRVYTNKGIKKLKIFIEKSEKAIPITLIHEKDYKNWLSTQSQFAQGWVVAHAFDPTKGTVLSIPGGDGKVAHVVVGLMNEQDVWALARAASIATGVPDGEYQVMDMPFYKSYSCMQSTLFYLAWGLEQYRFSDYKPKLKQTFGHKSLVISDHKDYILIKNTLMAVCQVRDWINTPAQDLNPITLEEIVKKTAEKYHASFKSIVGDELLKANFPAIHTVGRASVFPPRLLEFSWGDKKNPAVTLVGKGVCFDTGGLNVKPASGMLLMRKDMSGAAQVLGLASLIMEMRLPIYLRVLIPAVENSISGNAYRQGDIVKTRKGLAVHIDNTDAEGRLILSDALTYAMESPPEILIDIASLTGAAVAALGYDIASFFTPNHHFSAELLSASERASEYIWRMPLHEAYKELIQPETADLSNASLAGYAGSITAALFLQDFAEAKEHPNTSWVHFDTTGWNVKAKPGKPLGGEATVLRTLYDYLENRFTK